MLRQDDSSLTPEEQLLYQNLCLLGIASAGAAGSGAGTGAAASAQAPAGKPPSSHAAVEISKYTFRKPSPRAFEFVLYSLYATVKGKARAQKVGAPVGAKGQGPSKRQGCF